MRIYTFFSDTHTDILYKYFIPSLYKHENTELVIKKISQLCPTGSYAAEGWFHTMIEKVKFVIEACKENINNVFIYSDCDVQFFGPFVSQAVDELGNVDIACQNDVHPYGDRTTYCAGFFICRSSDQMINFFTDILNHLTNTPIVPGQRYDDQHAMNLLLDQVQHKLLSNKFYTVAQTKNALWDCDYNIQVPKDILVHHANWTEGISNKIKLLNFVKEQMT